MPLIDLIEYTYYDGLMKILQNVADGDRSNLVKCGAIEDAQQEVQKPMDTKKMQYYVKIQTRDTSCHFDKNKCLEMYTLTGKGAVKRMAPSFCRDFRQTYITTPIVDEKSLIVIMADRGRRLYGKLKTRDDLKHLLNPLRSYTKEMSGVVVHGDFLPHNFLIDDSGKLCVIDHDEGGLDKVARRAFDFKKGDISWFDVLRYPNALRRNRKEYTEIQFAASLMSLAPAEVNRSYLLELWVAASELGECLKQYELDNNNEAMLPGVLTDTAVDLIEKVNGEVDRFLSDGP